MQLSGFATGGVFARRNIVRISNIAARASVSEPPPAAKPPPVICHFLATPQCPEDTTTKELFKKILSIQKKVVPLPKISRHINIEIL